MANDEDVGGRWDGAIEGAPVIRRLGDYDLLEEVGRGGMGVVFKARQRSLGRLVAVKTLSPGVEPNWELLHRFRGEACAAACLHHPNLVTVFEVGVQDGQHYFAMEFIAGSSLGKLVGHQPFPERKAVTYLREIALAVQQAHEHGILHRDLKPSNILIDADDRPHVTDFGLARRLESESFLTLTGQVLGSPSYMAPEQLGGSGVRVDCRADVYALGAMLYHLLTGRPPFVGAELNDLLRRVLENTPVSPRLIHPPVSRDLEIICLKCLEKEPGKRYLSAREFADDLHRFLRGEPILARPVGAPERLWRWGRRNPRLAVVYAALLLAVSLAASIGYWGWRRSARDYERQRVAIYAADMRAAQIAVNEGNRGVALNLLRKHVSSGETDLRGLEWSYLRMAAQPDSRRSFDLESMVAGLAVAEAASTLAAIGTDGRLRLWSLGTGGKIAEITGLCPLVGDLRALAIDASGRWLVTQGADGLDVLDLNGLQRLATLPKGLPPVEFSHDGRWLATSSRHHRVGLWETGTWKVRGVASDCPPAYLTFRFTQDDRGLLWCHRLETTIHRYELGTEAPAGELPGSEQMVSLAISPDNRAVAVGTWAGEIHVREMASGLSITNWVAHPGRAFGLDFSPDGRLLASGGSDQVIRLWQTQDWQPCGTLAGHEDEVWDLRFAQDGESLWTASKDGTVRQFPVRPTVQPNRTVLLATNTFVCGVGRNGDRLLLCEDGSPLTVSLLDTATLETTPVLNLPPAWSGWMIERTGGCAFVLANRDIALLWPDHATEVSRRRLPGPAYRVLATSDGGEDFLVQESQEGPVWGRLLLVDATLGQSRIDFGLAPFSTTGALSADRRWAATASHESSEVVLWSVPGVKRHATLVGHRWNLYCVTFSPDASEVATGSWDGTARLWEVATGRPRMTLKSHQGGVNQIIYSNDGRTLLTVGDDEAMVLWNVATGREMLHLSHAFEALLLRGNLPRLSSDNRTLLLGPFAAPSDDVSNPGGRLRCVLVNLPTPAEIDAAGGDSSLLAGELATRGLLPVPWR